jgi:hypothetical protein
VLRIVIGLVSNNAKYGLLAIGGILAYLTYSRNRGINPIGPSDDIPQSGTIPEITESVESINDIPKTLNTTEIDEKINNVYNKIQTIISEMSINLPSAYDQIQKNVFKGSNTLDFQTSQLASGKVTDIKTAIQNQIGFIEKAILPLKTQLIGLVETKQVLLSTNIEGL